MTPANAVWESKDNSNPYQNEWDELIDAIRKQKPPPPLDSMPIKLF